MFGCFICGEDINAKGQDNVSPICGYPVCEDCIKYLACVDCGAKEDFAPAAIVDFDCPLCVKCYHKRIDEEEEFY